MLTAALQAPEERYEVGHAVVVWCAGRGMVALELLELLQAMEPVARGFLAWHHEDVAVHVVRHSTDLGVCRRRCNVGMHRQHAHVQACMVMKSRTKGTNMRMKGLQLG